jgi:hypothetical protein
VTGAPSSQPEFDHSYLANHHAHVSVVSLGVLCTTCSRRHGRQAWLQNDICTSPTLFSWTSCNRWGQQPLPDIMQLLGTCSDAARTKCFYPHPYDAIIPRTSNGQLSIWAMLTVGLCHYKRIAEITTFNCHSEWSPRKQQLLPCTPRKYVSNFDYFIHYSRIRKQGTNQPSVVQFGQFSLRSRRRPRRP